MIFNKRIKKSKEIIKREKEKILAEKKKIKQQKKEKFYNTKIGKILRKIVSPTNVSAKSQILSMIYFEIIGFLICILVFFILSGGKNYFRLYKELKKLINVYDTITTNYYEDLDKEELIDTAIEAMMAEAGDSYTTYSDKQDTTDFLESINGMYEGIGCTVAINQNKEIYVVSVFEDSPAEEAGVLEKDIILKIDNQDFQGKTSEDVADYIKNNKKDKIKLTIKRDGKEQELTIIRKQVQIPTITGKVITNEDKKIGYIEISVFSSITYSQFKKELNKLEKEKIKGLIIDVRGNTGGYLNSVTDITSMFLKKGQIIYQLEKEGKTDKIKDKTKEYRDYPVAVLVNVASASASEILASAIKESYHGLVVGTNTFGKGTVQKTKTLTDGSMIKVTVQKWLTPNGNWINEKGVEPTDFVELKSSTTEETETKVDKQLQTALDLISGRIK